MLTVGVDIDGVLAAFNHDFVEKVIEVTEKDLFPKRPFEITTWNYPESYGYTHDDVHEVWKVIKCSHDFWANLLPYPDTREFLEELTYLDADIYFFTARPGLRSKLQTEIWLELLGFPKPTVLLSADKGGLCRALDVNYYIDDKDENCEDVRRYSPLTHGYMLARPWNHKIKGVPRLEFLREFLTIVQSALEE